MNLTIRQLETIVAVTDAAGFTEAATRLGITQPSLSETIKRVEEELGIRIFERTTRSVSLTPEGQQIVTVARDAVRDFHLSMASVADRTQGRSGKVTVAALPSIACAVLPGAIKRFSALFPGVTIRLHDVLHDRAVGMVLDGSADIALSTRPASRPQLHFREIGGDVMCLVCRKDHPLAARDRVIWSDVAAYPFVALAPTSSVRKLTDAAFMNCGLAVEPTYEVEQIPSVVALVNSGLGIAVLPEMTLAMSNGRNLTSRLIDNPTVRRNVGAITLDRRVPTKPVKALLDCIVRGFEERTQRHGMI